MSLQRVLRASYSTPASKPRSRHADFYASLLPAMIPVALLGSAVYTGLHLAQSHLAHEKFLDEAEERVRTLQQEVDALQSQRPSAISTCEHAASSQRGSSWSWL